MIKVSKLRDDKRVETFGLTDEQHNIAVEMVKNNPFDLMQYDLVKVDPEMIKVWIEQTGVEEYGRWLEDSMREGADIYTLKDELQELGEVAIFY